uniref:Uncharacterized protein n=1 Tax=Siphoviridae sp. ctqSm5 TaxID=2827949 RepID=A0A8S5SP55_9CAUD|nr:MAG TPA: hypothetical protein [Siphoviridae sp. ctqSm5]
MASDATKQTISQSLNDLKAEVADRTKSIITGVKIPELTNSLLISPTDYLIIETDRGTQKISIKTLSDYIKTII